MAPARPRLPVVRVAATGDLHYGRYSPSRLQRTLAAIAEAADVLVVCGDLTDYGLPDEARALARELSQELSLPIVCVLGNHDFESGDPSTVRDILRDAGIIVLDGDSCEIHGVGFAGVKGFGGGFGRRALGSWGEPVIKQFVQEALNEALKLETALARLRTADRVAVLHYAPIAATVAGEPEELYPFLGSSRLEDPLNRLPVSVVFHGHAHRGHPEGRTSSGAPVYNVSLPLLERLTPDRPFKVIEFRPGGTAGSDGDPLADEATPTSTSGTP
ncbi:MAG: metallophosphoesterase [Acidobacteria bacterium]|nr:metallophosphoesterase [Acidobacteriota bacterium]